MVRALLDQLSGFPPGLTYAVIAVLVFAEAALFVGFVVPGETAVLLGGVLAAAGHLSLALLAGVVVVAAVVGDTVGFEVGRHGGTRLLASRPLRRHSRRLDGARAAIRRRGGAAVFLGRFTAFLRAVMPALAGLSQMPYRRFLVFNAAGALVWGVTVSSVGYVAGSSYRAVEQALGRGSAVALVLVSVVLGGVVLVRRRHRRRMRTTTHPGL